MISLSSKVCFVNLKIVWREQNIKERIMETAATKPASKEKSRTSKKASFSRKKEYIASESILEEGMVTDQNHALREVTLRTLPFAGLILIAIYATSRNNLGSEARAILLLVSVILLILTFIAWFPK